MAGKIVVGRVAIAVPVALATALIDKNIGCRLCMADGMVEWISGYLFS